MSQQNRDFSTWNTSLMAPRIVCFALAMSCVIYAGLMVVGVVPGGAAGPLMYVLPGIGVLMFPVSFLLSQVIRIADVSSPTKEVPGVFGEETVLADPVDARKKFVRAATVPFLVRCAVNQSAAVFALVAFMVGGTPLPICLGLCGAAALMTLTLFPRTADWKKCAEAKLGARFADE